MNSIDPIVFGLRMYCVSYMEAGIERSITCYMRSSEISAFISDFEKADGVSEVKLALLSLPGVKISLTSIHNAMQDIGCTGDLLPFDVFQKHYPSIHEIVENRGLLSTAKSSELVAAVTSFSEMYLTGMNMELFVVCGDCKVWYEYPNEAGLQNLYSTTCFCGSPLYVVESQMFKDPLTVLGKWDKLQHFKRTLTPIGSRDCPVDSASDIPVYGG